MMSGLFAFASGVVSELNTIEKEKRAARAKTAAAAAESALFEKQEKFKSGLIAERDKDAARRELEVTKRASVADALQQAIEDGTITDAGMKAIGKGLTTFDPAWIDLTKSASAIEAAGTVEKFIGDSTDYKLRLSGEMEYGSGSSPYTRSQVFWDSWQQQLSTEAGFNDALDFFNGNEAARGRLEDMVKKNEGDLRVGNINAQRKSGIEETGLKYIDLSQDYGNAARLFDELGFKNVEEMSLKAIGAELYDIGEDEEAILFPTQDTADGGLRGGVFIPMKKGQVQTLTAMANRTGYASAQDMVAAFNFRAGERPEGVTDQEFAIQQNDILLKAVKLERAGYGDKLSNPALMSKQDYSNLYSTLQSTFGNDKQGMIQALSLLTATPEGTFAKTRRYRYSGNVNQKTQAVGTGAQFVERITGLKSDDFNEGFKAQDEAVAYIDRLIELETEIGEKVGTGWVKDTAATFKSFGIQIAQGTRALGTLFSENNDFAMTANGTSHADLEAVIKKVDPTIDLAAISEADAIRLTLAAKMARAVDPSGRLSNQDFEIQLRRLGDKTFSTPQSIRAALQLVRKEFAADLEYKSMLKRVMDNQTKLTPQVARTVQAHITYRGIERTLFGAKGFEGVTQEQPADDDVAVVKVTTKPSTRTLDGNTLHLGSDNKYYLDPEATQPVPPNRVKDIK
tara:strand:+ start:46 stop:2091 length:2046 start_codon:yes stop_codon:yes gene_type:complete